jgi:hypothetical protein
MEAVEFRTSASNGVIEIPSEYRKDFSTALRVILIKNPPRPQDGLAQGSPQDIRERLAAAQRLVGIATEIPLSLDEIRAERLARQ